MLNSARDCLSVPSGELKTTAASEADGQTES